MKPKEILLNTPPINESIDNVGDDHMPGSFETPMKKDAFAIDDDTKIIEIEKRFSEIMEILGLDLTDDSLKGTPRRVAKMYVKEVFSGLDPKNKPVARLFDNKYNYDQMVVEKEITLWKLKLVKIIGFTFLGIGVALVVLIIYSLLAG